MEILLSWLHFLQIFLIGFGIVLLSPVAFFIVRITVNAVISFFSFLKWGFKK